MKYKAVGGSDTNKLTQDVQRNIDDGWIPFGSISVATTVTSMGFHQITFAQAMIKYDDPEPIDVFRLPV